MSTPPVFRHSEPGTSEAAWLLDTRWEAVPALAPEAVLEGCDSLLVLAAHPDDESLGAAGLIAAAGRAGLPAVVIVASSGEQSHPRATAWSVDDLGRARRAEARRAVEGLAADNRLVQLAVPDGRVSEHEGEIAAAASPFVGPRTLVLAPWSRDGHPDHDAVGRVAARLGARVWEYPVWAWQWADGDVLPWERLRQVPLDVELVTAKRTAIEAHGTQTTPLGPGEGDAPVLGPHVRARFERLVETYVVPADEPVPSPSRSERAETFDELLGDGDPWDLDGWYERRKRAVTLAALGRERYDRVLDLGCATGRLTADLAARAGHVTAVDVSQAALDRARAHVPDPHVEWLRGELPGVLDEVSGSPFDLVVISEVGYFLRGDEWLATVRGARRLLADGGEIVLCHWRHPTTGIPLDGPLAHRQAHAMLDLPLRVRHEEPDLLLSVHGGRPLTTRGAR